MARPTKLTPKLRNTVVDAIRAGNYAEIAAAAAGIGESTYYSWLARARRELERIEHAEDLLAQQPDDAHPADRDMAKAATKMNTSERPFVEFLEAVTRASAQAELLATDSVRKAMEGWREPCGACDGAGTITVKEAGQSRVGEGKAAKTTQTRSKATVRTCAVCEGAGEIVHDPDWKAAAWYLERRNPERWRRRSDAVVTLEGSETAPIGIVAAAHAPVPGQSTEETEQVARAAHDFLRAARRAPAVDPAAG